jgi:YD repeat-containing protein
LSQSLYVPSDSNPANSGITLGTTNWAVGYDATGRITSFNDPTTSATSGFTYDANGNLSINS